MRELQRAGLAARTVRRGDDILVEVHGTDLDAALRVLDWSQAEVRLRSRAEERAAASGRHKPPSSTGTPAGALLGSLLAIAAVQAFVRDAFPQGSNTGLTVALAVTITLIYAGAYLGEQFVTRMRCRAGRPEAVPPPSERECRRDPLGASANRAVPDRSASCRRPCGT